ncbi:ExbD/TolR family protein [Litorilituus lipolyticus]|uniref:Biopolymer transporter ExbD n=1 Tax=Litorilituus lipolyticus TaxID=2491017 RepID=A0A502KVF1_9GAMM|nr:biopolymer transporter ExbD [Litorilituus lipolyticus]TPH14215.1 biopolymer transporter ExbD [Litorilituus lipolyticus]
MRHINKMLQEQEEKEDIDMTPMLDVVFILLIFFIVTASFVKEAGIDVNRPEAATAVKKERANILVAISDKGDVWINKRKVDIRSVQANIERLKAENPQGTVVIQADQKATTDILIKVMDSARAAGVFDVSIAAQEA